MSVKREIIEEIDIIRQKLFNDSHNILDLLVRGTDYISIKLSLHSIIPTYDMVIKISPIPSNFFFIYKIHHMEKIRKIFKGEKK